MRSIIWLSHGDNIDNQEDKNSNVTDKLFGFKYLINFLRDFFFCVW